MTSIHRFFLLFFFTCVHHFLFLFRFLSSSLTTASSESQMFLVHTQWKKRLYTKWSLLICNTPMEKREKKHTVQEKKNRTAQKWYYETHHQKAPIVTWKTNTWYKMKKVNMSYAHKCLEIAQISIQHHTVPRWTDYTKTVKYAYFLFLLEYFSLPDFYTAPKRTEFIDSLFDLI